MTQILSFISKNYIVQVSDRTISSSHFPVNDQTNKVIVASTRDALSVIGYTGLAFVGGKPTDEFIAESLWGERIPSRLGMLIYPDRTNNIDIGYAEKDLSQRLAALSNNRHTALLQNPLHISIAGFRIKKNFAVAFSHSISKSGKSNNVHIERAPRHSVAAGRSLLVDTGGWIQEYSAVVGKSIFEEQLFAAAQSEEAAVDALSEIILEISKRRFQVGGNLMSVVLTLRPFEVRVRYSERSTSGHADFMPMFVGEGVLCGPTHVGGADLMFGARGARIVFEAIKDVTKRSDLRRNGKGIVAYVEKQDRLRPS